MNSLNEAAENAGKKKNLTFFLRASRQIAIQ
jgi:hypothetical protein